MEGQDDERTEKQTKLHWTFPATTGGANYVRFHTDNVQHRDFPFMKAFLMPGVTQNP